MKGYIAFTAEDEAKNVECKGLDGSSDENVQFSYLRHLKLYLFIPNMSLMSLLVPLEFLATKFSFQMR